MWQIVMIILTSVIDGRTNTVVDNIRVGNMPISVSINPNTITVANGNDDTPSLISFSEDQ